MSDETLSKIKTKLKLLGKGDAVLGPASPNTSPVLHSSAQFSLFPYSEMQKQAGRLRYRSNSAPNLPTVHHRPRKPSIVVPSYTYTPNFSAENIYRSPHKAQSSTNVQSHDNELMIPPLPSPDETTTQNFAVLPLSVSAVRDEDNVDRLANSILSVVGNEKDIEWVMQ